MIRSVCKGGVDKVSEQIFDMKVVSLHITVVDASTVGRLVAPLEIGKVAAVLLELGDLEDANSACIFP